MHTIILPTFNEKQNIVSLIHAIRSQISVPHEILVVDDSSPDGTFEEVQKAFSDTKEVKAIIRENNRGLVHSLQEGIIQAKGDVVVWMDSDFSHPPELLPKLFRALETADVAIASRFVPPAPSLTLTHAFKHSTHWLHHYLSKWMNRFITKYFKIPLYDWTSGFIAIRKPLLENNPLNGNYGEYFVVLMIDMHLKHVSIKEISFSPIPRRYGKSKTLKNPLQFFRFGLGYFKTILNQKKRF